MQTQFSSYVMCPRDEEILADVFFYYITDPLTFPLFTELQWASSRDVERCVAAAERGLESWSSMSMVNIDPCAKRLVLPSSYHSLLSYADVLEKNANHLHWLEGILVGKEARVGLYEVSSVGDMFRYYAQSMATWRTEVVKREDNELVMSVREPYGITAGICAYNAPLGIYASETNPLSTLLAVSLASQAGIPNGVIQCITGGLEPGKALAEHAKIRKLSFTGSIPAGKAIQVAAARSNLKSVTLELGVKSPVVIFPDADLDKAAQNIAGQLFLLNAQVCATGSRIYAHESIVDDLVAKMKTVVDAGEAARVPGRDPLDMNTTWSPIYNHRQHEVVKGFLSDIDHQGTVVTGGAAVEGPGCYVQPTILRDPIKGARVVNEEIFGPILVVDKFTTEEEALAKANDTETGLTATLWTTDFGRILRLCKRMEAGMIQVNRGLAVGIQMPFAGWKRELRLA
ncbi:Aldehyde dehydrogenase [Fusarium albosuccineum]|uniref:aldehyde dehydrogenase (NAD(+)) n=1 Tax=Fusarium albosuccineum TaxID=1237068 RepID=A0A8H4KZ09_9HYPO|nr:Aldehyde dehydrogenase [Fusarium albosuccineum]